MQSAHCLPPEACGGLGQYSDYVTVAAGHQDHLSAAYSAPHHVATDFPTPMYVNTMWGAADQAQVHHQPAGVYYDAYPPPMYSGYPGHMVQGSGGHQDGGIHSGYGGGLSSGSSSPQDGSQLGPGGKRKRRRVITFEQRKAANVRERKRMCHLNDAFDVLRKRVPTFAYEKKLSRIETLKLAVTYIQYMAELLEDLDDSGTSSPKSKKSTASSQQDSHNQSGGDISVHGGDASVTATSSPQSYSNRSDSPASKGNSPINVLEGGHDTIDSISDSRATGLQLGRLVVGTAGDSASATAELMVSSQTSEVSLGNEEAELDIGGGVEAAASPIH